MKRFTRPDFFAIFILAALGLSVGDAFADGGIAAHDDSDPAAAYDAVSRGTRKLVLGPVTIKMLLEASNLGRGDVEIGELTLPVGYGDSSVHAHGSLEIFYVVEGILGHEVNGKLYALNPGDVGFLNAGDQIRHSVLSEEPVKALVIWVPGGEAEALIKHAGFKSEPIE
jgi:mannose-6-phosphate isomerase-like protein (cupin superfamily)